VTARAVVQSAALAIHALSEADGQTAGVWAVIATAFVFRTTPGESVAAAKTRVAATALSFALCFAYLLFLPFHPWALALLIAVGSLVLNSAGQPGDVPIAGITIGAVMIIAALSPHDPWRQPLIAAVATAVGIALGLGASWLANRLTTRSGISPTPSLP
jgi:uncharacterized membrane protein YccC